MIIHTCAMLLKQNTLMIRLCITAVNYKQLVDILVSFRKRVKGTCHHIGQFCVLRFTYGLDLGNACLSIWSLQPKWKSDVGRWHLWAPDPRASGQYMDKMIDYVYNCTIYVIGRRFIRYIKLVQIHYPSLGGKIIFRYCKACS